MKHNTPISEAVYRRTVWPALWAVLNLQVDSATSTPAVQQRMSRQLQKTFTHALQEIIDYFVEQNAESAQVERDALLRSLSDGLLCDHSVDAASNAAAAPSSSSSAALQSAAHLAAIEMERLFVLVCSAVQMTSFAGSLLHPKPMAKPALAAEAELPRGISLASISLIAGIYALQQYIDCHTVSPRRGMPGGHILIHSLAFTFLYIYLQQLSSSNPKDVSVYVRFITACSTKWGEVLARQPISSSDSDSDVADEEAEGGCCDPNGATGVLGKGSDPKAEVLKSERERPMSGYELAALCVWATLPVELLKDVISRTRFRRAALLFKSCVPMMTSQAPTVVFFLADLLIEFERQWQLLLRSIAPGQMDPQLCEQLLRYGGCVTASVATESAQWRTVCSFLEAFHKRLGLLLGAGTPHGSLVASTLCTVLTALYIRPRGRGGAASVSSIRPETPTVTAKHLKDEQAAATAVEAGGLLPRRYSCFGDRGGDSGQGCGGASPLPSAPASLSSPVNVKAFCDVAMTEAEWVLRHYAPFGQLIASLHMEEVLKAHLFHSATHLRVGRSTAQQAENIKLLALTFLLSGVGDAELTTLIYHFAHHPQPPYSGPSSQPPVLPLEAMARYTAAVAAYVEQAHSELIFDMISHNTSLSSIGILGEGNPAGRRVRYRRGGGAEPFDRARNSTTVAPAASTFPSHGELHTPRFSRMVYGDAALLSWRQYLTHVDDTATPATAVSQMASPLHLSPCAILLDLLVCGCYQLAAQYTAELAVATTGAVDVLLLPRRALPNHMSGAHYLYRVLQQWLRRWATAAVQQRKEDGGAMVVLAREMYFVLQHISPLLFVVQSYLATQGLLAALLDRLIWLCDWARTADTVTASTVGLRAPAVFGLAEQILIRFLMPCIRVLPPSPMLYDSMAQIFAVFSEWSSDDVVGYGVNAALPLHAREWLRALLPPSLARHYRPARDDAVGAVKEEETATLPTYPHDVLQQKEREGVLAQCLKRLNVDNVAEYKALLKPVMYAEPLLVAHRLFTQAVGYNNNFLSLHTQLLSELPGAVLTLIMHQGVLLMYRYAAEEKLIDNGGESRVAILAVFLATLWRDNVSRMDGTLLVRVVEYALRSDAGEDTIIGTELCKALLVVMAHRALEHQENYNAVQLQALTLAPSTTSFLGRGAMTSLRVRLWKNDGTLKPMDILVTASQSLSAALQEWCEVPLQMESDTDSDLEEGNAVTAAEAKEPLRQRLKLGHQILLHLCRLQSRIYELQKDADGPAELIVLSSSGRFNTINDILQILEELLPAPDTADTLTLLTTGLAQLAMPHMAHFLENRVLMKYHFQQRLSATHSSEKRNGEPTNGVAATYLPADYVFCAPPHISEALEKSALRDPSIAAVVQQLWYFTASHFEFDVAPYDAARHELQSCRQHAKPTAWTPSGANAVDRWLDVQAAQVNQDEARHRELYTASAPARATLMKLLRAILLGPDDSGATSAGTARVRDSLSTSAEREADILDLAVSHLLPRAVLSLREAATVAGLLKWLLAASGGTAQQKGDEVDLFRRRVLALVSTFLSAAATYFVGLTDGECKRLGFIVQQLLCCDGVRSLSLSASSMSPALAQLLFPSNMMAMHGYDMGDKGPCGTAALPEATIPTATAKVGGASAVAAAAIGSSVSSNDNQLATEAAFKGFFVSGSCSNRQLLDVAKRRGLLTPATSHQNEKNCSSSSTTTTTRVDAAAAALHPAYPLLLEAFLCRFALQILTREVDVPQHVHRNLFLMLDQLVRSPFPSTAVSTDVLLRCVEPHVSEKKSYYAVATAVLKALRASRRHQRLVKHSLSTLCRSGGTELAVEAMGVYQCWRLHEHYMRQILTADAAVLLDVQQRGGQPISLEEADRNDEDDDNESDIDDDNDDNGIDEAQQQQEHPSLFDAEVEDEAAVAEELQSDIEGERDEDDGDGGSTESDRDEESSSRDHSEASASRSESLASVGGPRDEEEMEGRGSSVEQDVEEVSRKRQRED